MVLVSVLSSSAPNPLPMTTSTITKSVTSVTRVQSIDFLRGIVMIIMALDHVRNYFHADSFSFSPTDLTHTTPALFATRWSTHLCAPTFIFLAGTAVYFVAQRKSEKYVTYFLLTRGLWLIVLQLTVVRFAWNFDIGFHYNSSNIISTIGFSMIALAGLIRFSIRTILVTGLVMVAGHNALDNISFTHGSLPDIIWSFLHVPKTYYFAGDRSFSIVYPLIPWIGVMALGYCLGSWYEVKHSPQQRKKRMLQLGIILLLIFVILRFVKIYGDPEPWSHHLHFGTTVMSFFNLAKYPPSLLFLCVTLGISITLLGLLEGKNLEGWKPIIIVGKTALFYYVLHLFVIHTFALLVVISSGFSWQTMIFMIPPSQGPPLLKGKFGYTLSQVYMIWIGVVLFLYPFCFFWNSLKSKNKKKWWVSYV